MFISAFVATISRQGNAWLDSFTFWDALVVALVSTADFLLYPAEKLAIKDRIAQWWIQVDDSEFTGFVKEDAERLGRFIEGMFGSRWLSLRFILIEVAISLMLTWLLLDRVPAVQGSDQALFGGAVIVFFPVNALFGWLSLASTLAFFRKMARATDPSQMLVLSCIDLLLLGIFVCLTLATTISVARFLSCFLHNCNPLVWSLSETRDVLVVMLERYPIAAQRMIVAATVGGVFSILHLLTVMGFLISKVLTPVLKPLVSRFLYGVHDAPVGALSLFAVITGGILKLVELYFKAKG
jgi:hypothetical protein